MQWLGKRLVVLTTGRCAPKAPLDWPRVGVRRHPALGAVAVLLSTSVLAFNLLVSQSGMPLVSQSSLPWFLRFYVLLLPVVGSVFVVK